MAQLFVKVEMTTFVYDEHLQFMEILQNPTKHLSRTEQRRRKLIAIGVEAEDIIDQDIEDDAIDNKAKKTPKDDLVPKMSAVERKDPKATFLELGFQVLLRFLLAGYKHYFILRLLIQTNVQRVNSKSCKVYILKSLKLLKSGRLLKQQRKKSAIKGGWIS